MRRKDKEINDISAIEGIIRKARVCRLVLLIIILPRVECAASFATQKIAFTFDVSGEVMCKALLCLSKPAVCMCSVQGMKKRKACRWHYKMPSDIHCIKIIGVCHQADSR